MMLEQQILQNQTILVCQLQIIIIYSLQMKTKQKKITVYDIFRRSEDPNYPEQLAKLILNSTLEHEVEKAEYLLDIWVQTYKHMAQIDKSRYYTIIPTLLKTLSTIYTTKGIGSMAISTMYLLNYKKWNELTTFIQKGLKESKVNCLILFWKICHNMLEFNNEVEKEMFGLFLSEQFQEPLSMYKWKSHEEKIYILQSIKFINAHLQYKAFIENGKRWADIIKMIKEEDFQTEISGEKRLQLFKFEYEQKKKQIAQSMMVMAGGVKTARKETVQKAAQKQKSSYEIDKEKQAQKQFLSREQINAFLVVKDEAEQKQIYRIELLTQIINCRPLLSQICEDYWLSLCYTSVLEICKRMDDLNYDVRIDVLLSKLFLSLLKYSKTAEIIREKIGEEIVVKIIKNIESLGEKSPFENAELSQIPTLVNQAFFYISPAAAAQGVTIQSMINKRIRSIIDQASSGKEDTINRSLMTVSCRDELILKKHTLAQIQNFIMGLRKRKGVFIQTCIILVKILLSSFNSPQFRQLEFFPLALSLTQISQLYMGNKKVSQLRKLNIKLLQLLIPQLHLDYTEQSLLIDSTLKWLQNVEKNFAIVFEPMIQILTMLVVKYQQYFTSQPKTYEFIQKISEGIKDKLGHQHNSENMYAFLNFLLTAYIKLNWDPAYRIYQDLPQSSFIDWQIIYRKEARIIFKKEDENKIRKKEKQEQQKKKKEKEWQQNVLNRKTRQQPKKSDKNSTEHLLSNQSVVIMTPQLMQQQKKCEQKMELYFGEVERNWLKQLIIDHQVWDSEYIMRSEFGVLEFSILQTMFQVERDYYHKTHRPNEFWKKIIKKLDNELYKLYKYLMDGQSYQLLFLFASKIYFVCRDFYFVTNLKSYNLIQTRCFQILSMFFNKVQILYASSFFCSLILPYINRKQLKEVYDYLNKEEFLTDLFKGSNEFIGKEKCYYPWLIKILMAFQATQEFRTNEPMVKEALTTLSKNVLWWANTEYMINGQIDVQEFQTKDEKKRLIFKIFKEEYKKMVDKYYSFIETKISNKIKQRQLEISISEAKSQTNNITNNTTNNTMVLTN